MNGVLTRVTREVIFGRITFFTFLLKNAESLDFIGFARE